MYSYENVVMFPGPEKTREYLRYYGFQGPKWYRRYAKYIEAGGLLLAVLLLGYILSDTLTDETSSNLPFRFDIYGIATAVAGAWFAFRQWREDKEEDSMDKYYTRLDRTNDLWKGFASVQKMMDREDSEEGRQQVLYVCMELDNLEYVLEKYKLGYITDANAHRGLRTFQGRCRVPEFRRRARERVRGGDYNTETIQVTRAVCNAADELFKGEQVLTENVLPGFAAPQLVVITGA